MDLSRMYYLLEIFSLAINKIISSLSQRSSCIYPAVKKNILTQFRPLHTHVILLEAEMEEIERHERAQCARIMLEAGADFSLELDKGDCLSRNAFIDAVLNSSLVNTPIHIQLKRMLMLARQH